MWNTCGVKSGILWYKVERIAYFWDGNRDMVNLLGEFAVKLDSKGRLALPAGLLRQLPPESAQRFVINRGFEQCLTLYPYDEWERLVTRIRQNTNPFSQKHRSFIRNFFRGATLVQPDRQQRILIPKPLLDYAGIDREAILFAHFGQVEIWNPQRYQQALNMPADQLAALAEEVMGPLNPGHDAA